jgi:hypothetical protein
MKGHRLFRLFWGSANGLIVLSLAGLLYGLGWEYSTHRYLQGFVNAIIPLNGSPEEKCQALLQWLVRTPGRLTGYAQGPVSRRDPEALLSDAQALNYCGRSTAAFISLAARAELKSRRLLLINPAGVTNHVVAEVKLGGRWVVVDPTFGVMFRDPSGRLLTKQELEDPEVFQDAISRIPGYPPAYSFAHTSYLHLGVLPMVSRFLGGKLRRFLDGSEVVGDWAYVTEHASIWPVAASLFLLGLVVPARAILAWYLRKRLGITPVRFRERLKAVGQGILFRET